MNTLIDPLKRIARDLVDKKLWPVAVLLLAAIVAVPVMIGGGSSSEEAPAPAAVAAVAPAATGSKSLVTVVDQAVTGKEARPGRVDDPFYDPPDPPEPASSSDAAPAASTGGATTGGATPSGDAPAQTSPASPATPGSPTTPAEPVASSTYYSTVVRWYSGAVGKAHPIRRLTPFGGLAETTALYLGVTKSNGNHAIFLLGPNATSAGEAKCSDDACRVFGLKSGQTQVVTVRAADGGAARAYKLEVVRVSSVPANAAIARKMRARVHADGRDAMRKLWQDAATAEALRPIQYDRDTGLLVKSATETRAAR